MDWKNKILCPSGIWFGYISESQLSADSTKIYLFFTYGNTVSYLYFATFAVADGSVVGTRYRSSIYWVNVYGSAQRGDYIIVTVKAPPYYLIVYNMVFGTFKIKGFNGDLYGWALELNSGR